MDEKCRELKNRIHTYLPDADFSPLEKAYDYAAHAHAGQRRASGDEYFTHCYAVADILTELKLDVITLTAALLHDTIEDTPTTRADIQQTFGSEIASMVEGVTKISSYHFPNAEIAQAENWRKMLLAITKDVRVILIKLADRLHNLRTIEYLSIDKQKEIAAESLYLYAPFAQRLGIYRLKSQLEDLSFNILYPDDYRQLHDLWESRQELKEQSLMNWQRLLEEKIRPAGIPFRLSARPKSLYGVFKKMERQHKNFADIQDLIGLRLITDSVANCYGLLGIIHTQFTPFPGTFTDYISVPKINMYQSLHTTITGPGNAVAEIQIRTEEMHRWAEYGIAAHWRYKEKGDQAKILPPIHHEAIEEKLDWLKSMMEWQGELKDAREFMDAFKVECQFDQIFVFTPQGKVIKLPKNATPVDFAYAVHSDIGNACYGAMVGNKMVPLSYALNSGETCQILVRKNAHPNEHWLDHAVTARARAKIRRYLKEHADGSFHA